MDQIIPTLGVKQLGTNPLIFFVNNGLSEQLAEHGVILVAVFLQERKDILGKDAREPREIGDRFT